MKFWVFIQLIRWARCDLYYIFTVIDSYQKKKKKKQQHGSGREWESFFREWNGIFLQFFHGIGTGRDYSLWCILETGDEPLV